MGKLLVLGGVAYCKKCPQTQTHQTTCSWCLGQTQTLRATQMRAQKVWGVAHELKNQGGITFHALEAPWEQERKCCYMLLPRLAILSRSSSSCRKLPHHFPSFSHPILGFSRFSNHVPGIFQNFPSVFLHVFHG